MHIWLIKTGELLPCDPGNQRLGRMAAIADEAASRGHHVTLWTSTFEHFFKRQRYTKDTDVQIRDNYVIKMLHSPGYRRNLSFQRLIDHYILARKFKKYAYDMEQPDIVMASMPTIDFSLAATEYSKKKNVPVILDLRDMWPDIFVAALPRWLEPLGKLVLIPIYMNHKRAFKDATALFAITEPFLEWGLKKAGRERNPLDEVFHLSYNAPIISSEEIDEAIHFWGNFGIEKTDDAFIACFVGYFGRIDLITVIEAARILESRFPKIKVVLCGNGEFWGSVKQAASGLTNIILPGFVNQSQMWMLMKMSSIGLIPYQDNRVDFAASFPNKVGEYFAAGLPIVSSLSGHLEKLLKERNVGITYQSGDPEQLAKLLITLYQNGEGVKEMARNTCALFTEKFSAKKNIAKMVSHLERICMNGA